jgi:hypothetical protein
MPEFERMLLLNLLSRQNSLIKKKEENEFFSLLLKGP